MPVRLLASHPRRLRLFEKLGLKQARDANQPAVPGIIQLQIRLDAPIEEISRMACRILDPDDRTALQELAVCAIHKLTDVVLSLESAP